MRFLVGRDLMRLAVRDACWALARCRSAWLEDLALTGLGALADALHPEWRARAEAAIVRAGIAASAAKAIVRQGYRESWRDHLALCGPASDWTRGRVEIDGLEHFERARRRGRGVLLLESSRFGLRFTAKRALHDAGVRAHQLHGPIHHGGHTTWLARRVTNALARDESRFVDITWLPADGGMAWMRGVSDSLARGGVVGSSGDGSLGRRFVRHSFLGHDRGFATGWVSLARITGAAIIPVVAHELGPRDARVALGPAIEVAPGRDHALVTVNAYAGWLEQHVRERPGSYTAWHSLGDDDSTPPGQAPLAMEAPGPRPAIIREAMSDSDGDRRETDGTWR